MVILVVGMRMEVHGEPKYQRIQIFFKKEVCQLCNSRKTKSRNVSMKESREIIMERVKAGEGKE